MLSVLCVYFLYAVLQTIVKKLSDSNPQKDFEKSIVSCLCISVVTVILAQIMIDTDAISMGYFKFIWGVLIVSVVILFLYCLLGRIIPSIVFGAGVFMVISTINVYVYRFRGRLFEPVDVFSASTAMNVVENYSLFPIPTGILIGWGVFVSMLIVLYCLQHKSKSTLAPKKRLILLSLCISCSVAIFFYATNLKTYHWHKEGVQYNGYILDFVSKFKEISGAEPDNYSIELIDELASQYAADPNSGSATESPKSPHIIVIMDEAFSDLRVVGELETNMEYMPFISSLKEDTISGFVLTSVYGGNTANSEYEFLTGNSMAWLSPNVVPYQQYIRSSTYSMASYLKSFYRYKCVAMHPFQSSGWNRPVAYEYLGFDECYFVEDFPQKNFIRELISDQEMFEFLIETFENQKEHPLFIFGVTMQNHGGYTYSGEKYNQYITLEKHGDAYPEVEQYLSLIYETDRAVEYLIRYFQNVDDDVVIVFFGDHQPKLNESFYETVSGTTADTLDKQQKLYEVPFFVWANYDIEEKYIDNTSLNYLSSYVYDAAGIALPPYNQFLQTMEKVIPSMNANGFFSISTGSYLSFDEATNDEQRWLELYEVLQYNNIFDATHRSETFFPTLE
jgi:phosphoglycerol transferase MdoB-like AlkP superfamily enzyme